MIETLVVKTEEEGIRAPLIIANAGGSDETLSLYANLAKIEGQMPTMIVVDRKGTNLNNFLLRYYLTQVAGGSRENYIRYLFSFNGKGKLSTPSEIRKTLLDAKYDPEKHSEELCHLFKDFGGKDMYNFLEEPIYQMTGYLTTRKRRVKKANRKKYQFFVNGLADNMDRNPKTHYLSDDNLYRKVYNSIDRGKNPRYRVQAMRQDISTQEGQDQLRGILNRYGLDSKTYKPIDVAFIPGLRSGMDGLVPFLREKVRLTVAREPDR